MIVNYVNKAKGTKASMALLLHDILTESAQKTPDAVAVVCSSTEITYSELEKRSTRFAVHLRGLGVKRGDRAGIYMRKSIAYVAAMFGVLKVGAIYVPIDWFSPVGRTEMIVDDCGITMMIVCPEGMNKLTRSSNAAFFNGMNYCVLDEKSGICRKTSGGNVDGKNNGEPEDTITIDGDILAGDPAYILYTSGSTGKPKGVLISHQNALTFITMAVPFFNIDESDKILNIAPFQFDLSVFDLYCAFHSGGSVVLVTERESVFPVEICKLISGHSITIWNSVPSTLIQLLTRNVVDERTFGSIRLILFAGEPFPPKFLRQLMEKCHHAAVFNLYGQTEANTSMYFKVDKPPEDDSIQIPIGKPFPHYNVFALDENDRMLHLPGEEGELYIRSSAVACGYWGDREKTDEQFVTNPLRQAWAEKVYRTGDVVCLDGDRNYVFLRRKDTVIKSRGFRIDLGEIEAVINKVPEVQQSAVVALPDEFIGNRLVAVVALRPESAMNSESCLKAFSGQLPKYMLPEKVVLCEQLPYTATGKVDRKKIADTIGDWYFNNMQELSWNC